MAFNIKNPETHALAREIANLTGESMAQAVDIALRERRQRLGHQDVAAKLNAIAESAAAHTPKGASSADIDELLYDRRGLPK